MNAVLFVARTGIPWRDLPERFGPWNSVWKRFDRWCRSGVWARLADVLGEPDLTELQLDSTVARGARVRLGRPPAGRGEKEEADARRCLGRSRGGLTTKLHAAVDAQGHPVRLVLTAGQKGDAPQAAVLLEGLEPDHLVADTACDSDAIRDQAKASQAKACIKPNPTRKTKKRYDKRRYRHRNVVERFFGRVKQFRRVATRYEKQAANYLDFVWLAAVLTHLK